MNRRAQRKQSHQILCYLCVLLFKIPMLPVRIRLAFGAGACQIRDATEDASVAELVRAVEIIVTVKVKNTGKLDGDEVAQVYFRHTHSKVPQPRLALCGFTRVHIPPGETVPVSVTVPVERFRYWDTSAKSYVVEPGEYEILVGGASDELPGKLALVVRWWDLTEYITVK